MQGRRAYDKNADAALQAATLGPRRRMNGMAKIMSRAGKGLAYKSAAASTSGLKDGDGTGSSSDDDDDENKEEDRPFEPLCLWISPHQEASKSIIVEDGEEKEGGGDTGTSSNSNTSFLLNKGLPPRIATITREDEYGVEEQVQVLQPAPLQMYSKENVFVPPVLAKWLRPHQREGVQFMYECVMGLRGFKGHGWYVVMCLYEYTIDYTKNTLHFVAVLVFGTAACFYSILYMDVSQYPFNWINNIAVSAFLVHQKQHFGRRHGYVFVFLPFQ
jgi:hypothetical protein